MDFLGFNVRRYRGKLLIKPSKAAVKRIRARLTAEMRALRGHNAQMVLIRLNPIIRGWSAYYRHCVSARVFNELDHHVWKLTYKWAKFTHPHKAKRWIIARYFGAFNPDQARPVGVRRPRQRRLPAQVRLDEDHPAHAGQGLGVPGRPGPDRLLGGPAPTRETPAGPGPAAAAPDGSADAARSAGSCCCTPTTSRSTPTNGNSGSQPPARRSATTRSPSTRGPGTPTRHRQFRLIHTHCRAARQAAPAVDQHFCSPDRSAYQGLLEPVAWKAGTAGSEGAGGAAMRPGYPTTGPRTPWPSRRASVHLAHPLGVKGFAYRRVKNDVRDAADLADLLRMGRLPEAWIAPPHERELRELVRHRAKLVALRSGLKAQVHAVLAKQGLLPEVSDVFGRGRAGSGCARAPLDAGLPPAGRLAARAHRRLRRARSTCSGR